MKVLDLDAATILAVSDTIPELLFSAPEEVEAEYKALIKKWHPDVNKHGDATEVFQKIGVLYRAAKPKIAAGSWHVPGLLELRGIDGKTRRIKYKVERPFELGTMYIGDNYLVYVVDPQFRKLYDNAVKRLTAERKFPSPKLQEEVQRYIPTVKAHFETATSLVLALSKTPDLYSLRDVHEHFAGKIDPKHVAWMINRVYSFCCWLQWTKLTHNDICMDSMFISPPHHGMTMMGGWWYAVPEGEKLIGATTRTMTLMSSDVKAKKVGNTRVDLTLVRALACELLGDPAGTRLIKDKLAPVAMARWLALPTTGKAPEDYKSWNSDVLKPSFGERKFIVLDVNHSHIYKDK